MLIIYLRFVEIYSTVNDVSAEQNIQNDNIKISLKNLKHIKKMTINTIMRT